MAVILIADDDDDFRAGLAETLHDAGHSVIESRDGHDAMRQLEGLGRQQHAIDVVLLDLRMPGLDGLELLTSWRASGRRPELPFIMLTGFADTANTIDAMRLGAFDHLTKPVSRVGLLEVITRAITVNEVGSGSTSRAEAGAEAGAEAQSAARDAMPKTRDDELIGASDSMRDVQKRIGMATRSDAPVLITGETGTGKEVVARLLHRHGGRAGNPLVAVNCAAIPADLLESELFGHQKGAFSGALADRVGKFEAAHGGILFLDEIGDMPLAMQAKLLRVLQDGEITPVGATRGRRVDVRVVAATHHDLHRAVLDGRFRADLRFRLDVLRIHLPPLRERAADIVALAEHFLRRVAPRKRLSPAAAARLLQHPWPGNVRELRNVIERASVTTRADLLQAADLDIEAPDAQPWETDAGAASRLDNRLIAAPPDNGDRRHIVPAAPAGLTLPEAVERLERQMIEQALHRASGNRAEAARMLGIRRQLLYAKLTTLGIEDRPGGFVALTSDEAGDSTRDTNGGAAR